MIMKQDGGLVSILHSDYQRLHIKVVLMCSPGERTDFHREGNNTLITCIDFTSVYISF